jgi:hypothetical protein
VCDPRGRDRGGFCFRLGAADAVGLTLNKEATTLPKTKSARSRRVGSASSVCGVVWLAHSVDYGRRRAPNIRCLAEPTRLTRIAHTAS